MPGDLTVLELVRNGSMSAEMASTLWAAMDDRASFIVAAGPRQAGKSTMTEAILDFLPGSVPRHDLSGDRAQMDALAASPDGGYLVVSEFSDHTPSYLRGQQVVQVFDTAEHGFSIAGTLHADTPQDAFAELRSHGPIPDSQLERIGCLVFLGVRGWPENPVRWVSSIWQVDGVARGAPARPAPVPVGLRRRPVRLGEQRRRPLRVRGASRGACGAHPGPRRRGPHQPGGLRRAAVRIAKI